MKHILTLLLTILSILHVSAQDSWQLVWSDEFTKWALFAITKLSGIRLIMLIKKMAC